LRTRWIVLHHNVRSKLQRKAARVRDADTRRRYLIVLHADRATPKTRIAQAVGCARQTVDRVLDRYNALGSAGLIDRREDNGAPKIDTHDLRTLAWMLESRASDFFHGRPTWTQALLIDTARRYTGVKVSRRTMGRALKLLKVRRGRPKPLAPCPWPRRRREAVMSAVKSLIEGLPDDQACVWEDDNRIERCVWREMHANVTVNHTCRSLEELIDEVIGWLMSHNRQRSTKAA